MKKIILTILVVYLFCLGTIKAQYSITPLITQEYCPNTNTTFSITIPGYDPNLFGWTNNPIIVSTNYPQPNAANSTTFSFVGKFQDVNIAQTYGV